jgi:hypothetical protein
MKVGKAIEHLQKLNPDEDIFITWFDKKEFEFEFESWSDLSVPLTPISNDKWEGIVEGTTADDRIADAISESMQYDFNQIYKEYEQTQIDPEVEKELWDIELPKETTDFIGSLDHDDLVSFIAVYSKATHDNDKKQHQALKNEMLKKLANDETEKELWEK